MRDTEGERQSIIELLTRLDNHTVELEVQYMIDFTKILIEARWQEDAPEFTSFKKWCESLEKMHKGQSLQDALQSEDFLCAVLTKAGSSRTVYFNTKKRLLLLARGLGIGDLTIPDREKALSEHKAATYFKNIQEVLDKIDKVGFLHDGYDPQTDLAIVKAIAVLSWNGYKVSDMLTIKKNCPELSNRISTEFELSVIQTLAKLKEYRALNREQILTFNTDSELLFRPTGESEEFRASFGIHSHVYRFNSIRRNKIIKLNLDDIRKNGVFYRVAHDTSNDSIFKKMEKHSKLKDKTIEYYAEELETIGTQYFLD